MQFSREDHGVYTQPPGGHAKIVVKVSICIKEAQVCSKFGLSVLLQSVINLDDKEYMKMVSRYLNTHNLT